MPALPRRRDGSSPAANLIDRVWGWDFYGDERLVDVHIGNLRRAIGDAADEPRVVAAVLRGVGYKCVAQPS